ncbi:hypothetical protein OK016_09100 [Vibrio chagasii]|nr:hypothetical protein [Vibrio chagasii]
MHLEHKGLSLGQLGVSIGVATYPEKPASNTESLVKMADNAVHGKGYGGRSQWLIMMNTAAAESTCVRSC